jgi:hypothetical protein
MTVLILSKFVELKHLCGVVRELHSGLKAITKVTLEHSMKIRTDHKYNFKFCTRQFCESLCSEMPDCKFI